MEVEVQFADKKSSRNLICHSDFYLLEICFGNIIRKTVVVDAVDFFPYEATNLI